jgi:hypothetical protein
VRRLRLLLAACFLVAPEVLAQPAPDETPAPEGDDVESDTQPVAEESSTGEESPEGEIGTEPSDVEETEEKSTSASDLPPEGIPVPVYEPPTNVATDPGEIRPKEEEHESGDSIRYSGYLPGYRRHFELGQSPQGPDVGGLPGPTTAGFGAPMPPNEWTFNFSGFMTVSSQMSFDYRRIPEDGQSTTVTHVQPQTIDTYAHFTSTNALPGNWVNLRFSYGTSKVSANFSIDTYNPTAPTTFYQIGSQYFINNAFLSYSPAPVGGFKLDIQAGRFNLSIGQLGQYGGGMYVNPISANMQGVGLRTLATRNLNQKWELVLEHNLMTSRDGTIPFNVIRHQSNGWRRPLWVGSLMNGVHAGFNLRTKPRVEFRVRQLLEVATDDRLEMPIDDVGTRQIDERNLKDGSIAIYGSDVKVLDDTFGSVGIGTSYTVARHAYPLRGLMTYGGVGEDLTDRFLGQPSGGNGRLLVAALNYDASLGKIISYPHKFDGQGRDLYLQTSFHYTRTESDFEGFDGRQRYKMGADLEYALIKYMSLAARVDRVIPDSREKEQSFTVLAPRATFRTGWSSRLYFQVKYVKWFYGSRTRVEGAGERDMQMIDDDLFAANMNMWW